jgi:hypothetical protein
MLVALLQHVERVERAAGLASSKAHCPLRELIESAAGQCEQSFKPFAMHLQAKRDATALGCAAFQQMATLITEGHVKRRADQKACDSGEVFELLPTGRARAELMRERGEACEREPKRHHRRVERGERGAVIVLVDFREGGGEARGAFWDLCAALERENVRFETRALPIGAGDYQFVVSDGPSDGGAALERPLPWSARGKTMSRRVCAMAGGTSSRSGCASTSSARSSAGVRRCDTCSRAWRTRRPHSRAAVRGARPRAATGAASAAAWGSSFQRWGP